MRSLLSHHLPQLNRLNCQALTLGSLSFGLCAGLMLIEAPAASAEAATSIEVRFSGVVHPPCYGANADWSDEQDCELSRSEASFIEQPELSQPRQVPLTTAEENTEQWADGMEDNLARGQIHRQVNTGERYTRITLTPS